MHTGPLRGQPLTRVVPAGGAASTPAFPAKIYTVFELPSTAPGLSWGLTESGPVQHPTGQWEPKMNHKGWAFLSGSRGTAHNYTPAGGSFQLIAPTSTQLEALIPADNRNPYSTEEHPVRDGERVSIEIYGCAGDLISENMHAVGYVNGFEIYEGIDDEGFEVYWSYGLKIPSYWDASAPTVGQSGASWAAMAPYLSYRELAQVEAPTPFPFVAFNNKGVAIAPFWYKPGPPTFLNIIYASPTAIPADFVLHFGDGMALSNQNQIAFGADTIGGSPGLIDEDGLHLYDFFLPSINDRNEIVDEITLFRKFKAPGKSATWDMYLIDELLHESSGWSMQLAIDIDNSSSILCYGSKAAAPNDWHVLFLLPLEIQINGTADLTDDLVAVSNGIDGDLATDLELILDKTITGSFSAELSMKGTDGDIKFDPPAVTLTPGTPTKVKMWGKAPSSAKDSSTILVKLKFGTFEALTEKKVTVIDGVELTFEGEFRSPINAINEGWRPGVRDSPPLVANTPNAPIDVINSDAKDYSSSISFTDGDQRQTLRDWTPRGYKVLVSEVKAKNPSILLSNDILNGSEIHMISGLFSHNENAYEKILNPVIHFKRGSKSITSISILSTADYSTITSAGIGARLSVSSKIDFAAADPSQPAKQKLALWLQGSVGPIPHGDVRPGLNELSEKRYRWENKKFWVSKESELTKSLAAKALVGAQEKHGTSKTEAGFTMEKWDGWDLSGKVSEGTLTSAHPTP